MKLIFLGLIILLLVGGVYVVTSYTIPQLVEEDYNCEEHDGFISDSRPLFFESQQHYVNRKNKAIQRQINEVCD